MRYTGIQPQYFPRLHYFARIINTDIFMIRDDVQFVSKHKYPGGLVDKSYQAHTPIKTTQGKQLLFTPTRHHGYQPLISTTIAYDQDWVNDQLKTVRFAYSKAPFFHTVFVQVEKILTKRYTNLAELNTATIIWGLTCLLGQAGLDITLNQLNRSLTSGSVIRLRQVKLASSSKALKVIPQDTSPNEKILALIAEAGADEDYCGGTAHMAYMDDVLFAARGIKITVQNWKCKEYPQHFMERGFMPDLSIIDLLMNVPVADAVKMLLDHNSY